MERRGRRSVKRRNGDRWLDEDIPRYYFTILLLQIFALILIPLIPLPAPIYDFLTTIFQTIKGQVMSLSFTNVALAIFLHNMVPATLDMVPFFGMLIFVLSTIVTGLTLSAEAVTLGQNGSLLAIKLMTLPYSWIELSAYALSLSEGLILIKAGIKGRFWKELMSTGVRMWLLAMTLLFVAALFESATILLGFPLYYLTWIPFAMIVSILAVALRRKR